MKAFYQITHLNGCGLWWCSKVRKWVETSDYKNLNMSSHRDIKSAKTAWKAFKKCPKDWILIKWSMKNGKRHTEEWIKN